MTACVAHGRLLFLDIAADRYFALPDEDEPIFILWLASPGTALPSHLRNSLAALGVRFDAVDPPRGTMCTVTMPAPLDAAQLPQAPLSASLLIGVARSLWSAWRDVRAQRLGRALDRASAAMARPARGYGDLESRLAQFRAVRPLLPIPRVCLHDCLALIHWLGPRSGAELVIGVSPYPFGAHCWVQSAGRVIDDHPQSPSRFHPILHLS